MVGRKPKTNSRQIAEGDPRKRGKHKLIERLNAEPKATRGLPDCPEHLSAGAQAAWRFWAEELAVMSQDHMPDAMMLEAACVWYDRAMTADQDVNENGAVIEEPVMNKFGDKIGVRRITNPSVRLSDLAWRHAKAFATEFGFSPVSRTRLSLEKRDSSAEDLMAVLSGPREKREPTTVN